MVAEVMKEIILLFLSTNRDSHDIVDFSDLRKILVLPAFGELPQLAVFGDTFLVGCVFDKSNIHHKYFKDNPDYKCYAYNTKNGIYTEGCGLDNIVMSWGHNDYMYMVAKENGNNFPSAGLFIIRYHSFYTLRKKGAYTHLMNEEDFETLKWLEVFKYYDLYSKSNVLVDVEKVKSYHISLIEKVRVRFQLWLILFHVYYFFSMFVLILFTIVTCSIFLRSLSGDSFEIKRMRRRIILIILSK
ncbi:inositol oxygenase 2-like [Phaseolus vulgaris]|uniref:inositol oxygenase 2-like n=1 Tax=Phaseolus vulgaris TaxID=3885 RepID=UPI0035CC3B50